MGEEDYVGLTTKFMCRIGLKIKSGCGLQFRNEGFINTFSAVENYKSQDVNYISMEKTKLNATIPRLTQIILKSRAAASPYLVATQSYPYGDNTAGLPVSIHIAGESGRPPQKKTNLKKDLASSLKSLEILHCLRVKALGMVRPTSKNSFSSVNEC